MPAELLEPLLDSWDRNNRILVNLLGALPSGGLAARAVAGSPTVSELFTHMHYVRLVFIAEDVPDCARPLPPTEWVHETDPGRIAEQLNMSARAVREAVESRILSNRQMDEHYDHPLLLLQHLIWHEGYHHGQIKLALKISGHPIEDDAIGPLSWHVWMDKTKQ